MGVGTLAQHWAPPQKVKEDHIRYVLLLILVSAFTSGNLEAQELSLNLQIANPFSSIFRLENTSTLAGARIVGFSGLIGDTTYNFDSVGGEQILSNSGNALKSVLITGDPQQGGFRTNDLVYTASTLRIRSDGGLIVAIYDA